MESKKEQEIEIDLKEIFVVLLDRIWIIIGVGIILAALAGIATEVFITPMYTSTTKLYVINRQSDESTVTYSDLQTGSSLTNDYVIQVTGNKVLNQVIDNLSLDTTVSELQERITATNPDNTRYIVITVEDADPVVAQQIAESVAEVSAEVVMEVMDIEKVNVAEEANLPTSPSSPNLKKNIILGGVIGILLSIAVIIILFLLNDSIRTPEDIKKYLDLNTIGQIPVLESNDTKKKHRKRKKRPEDEPASEDSFDELQPEAIMPDLSAYMPDEAENVTAYIPEADEGVPAYIPEVSETDVYDEMSEAAATEDTDIEEEYFSEPERKEKKDKKKGKKKKDKKKSGKKKKAKKKSGGKSKKEDGGHE